MKKNYFLLCCLLFIGCSQSAEPNATVDLQENNASDTRDDVQLSEPITNEENSTASEANSTPVEAVHSFVEGIAEGNVERAKSAVVLNDKVEEYLLSNIDAIRAMDEFAIVDNEKFGAGGVPVGVMSKSLVSRLDNLETVMIGEDRAECMLNPPNPMLLVKSSGSWKIDFTGKDSEQLLELAPKAFRNTAKLFDEVRAKISDGTITSRSEARQEMKRIKQAQGL